MFSNLLSAYSVYVPWNSNYIERSVAVLRENVGTAFNVGFHIFALLTGVYLAISLVYSIGK